ncbi:MAG: type II secretion system F family protein [Rhizomicrobium sp.]
MTRFRYRAVLAQTGEMKVGTIEGPSKAAVLDALRRSGLMPLEASEGGGRPQARERPSAPRATAAARKGVVNAIGEMAVLLGAGLPLDRTLSIVVEHAAHPALKAAFATLRERVKAGVPLARALQEQPGLFPPIASALAEAGEASGKLEASLARLAETLERAESMRATVSSALIYPAMLLIIAVGVILVMLLFVIPQFEDMFADMGGKLPFATAMIVAASHFVRTYGLFLLLGLVGLAVVMRQWLRQPAMRQMADRVALRLPLLGELLVASDTARFARTLASLVDSGVPLVTALNIACRVIGNRHMAKAVARVADQVKEGGGLTRPLAAAGVFPKLALSFVRTGEETAQLGLMLDRLADVLDRDLRVATQRLMAIVTPLITVVLGLTVAAVIASIMSAILGINDLALQS